MTKTKQLLWTMAGLLLFSSCEKKREKVTITPIKKVIVDDLKRPWSMCFLSENDALVTEKDGDLLRVNLVTGERKVIMGFPEDLTDSTEFKRAPDGLKSFPDTPINRFRRGYNSGLFEVLKDPDFTNNQFIYVSYTAQNKSGGTTTKVIRARLEEDKLSDVITLLEATPYSGAGKFNMYHYGGGMVFGNDGKLYITIGERLFWEADEPEIPIAQDLTDKRGKIYRINKDGSIPDDNPDFGEGAVEGLYATGIRAAQGLAIDPISGNIWFSEHGTKQGDELNILRKGANYGWPLVTTGKYRTEGFSRNIPENTVFKDPVWYWQHTVAPTGLTFYNGKAFPSWKGNLLVPGLSKGNLWRFVVKKDVIVSAEELFINDRQRARKVIQSPEGKLYLLTEDLSDRAKGKVILIDNK